MANELTRPRVARDRCPYCHASVAPSDPAKLACAVCMAWHHTACLEEHGVCAACGAEVRAVEGLGAREATYREGYRRLFATFSRLLTALGVLAGAGIGWWVGDVDLAAVAILLGAVAGLLVSFTAGARAVGTTELSPVELDETPPAKGVAPPVASRVGRALFGPWLQASVVLGLAVGLLISTSAAGAAAGALGGASLGIAFVAWRARGLELAGR